MKNKSNPFKPFVLEDFFGPLTDKDRAFIATEKRHYYMVTSLYAQRKKLRLSQAKLAKKSRVPRATISKIENGTRNATLSTLERIAHALGKELRVELV